MEAILGIDLIGLIKTAGYAGLFLIIFAESGLFIGFFLPGDSLLFTAGFLASQGFLHIVPLTLLVFVAAILGDNFGYAFGRRVGPAIFNKEDSIFFHKSHLRRAEKFYERYGGKAIMIARFMPVIRTFAPILAGVGNMRYKDFLIYNFIGALIWAVGVTVLGYFLGSTIPNIDQYLIPIILLIVLASVIPPAIHFLKEEHHRKEVKRLIKKFVKLVNKDRDGR
jgi:membrane-associated protein